MWLPTSLCVTYKTVHSRHLCKKGEKCASTQRAHVRDSDCVKSPHLPSAETLLYLGVCLSPPLSANEEVRLCKLLHSGIQISGMKAFGLCVGTHRINHTWPAPPGTSSASITSMPVSYSQAYRECMCLCLFCLTPLHSHQVLLKHLQHWTQCATEKDRQGETDSTHTKKKTRGWGVGEWINQTTMTE